jgi:hypothetical protein
LAFAHTPWEGMQMSTKTRRTTWGLTVGLLVLLLAAFAVACGSEEQAATTTAAPTTIIAPVTTTVALSETDLIASNWEAFFAAATPVLDKVALLEKGDAHQAELAAWATNPAATGVSVLVTDVKVNADGTADVTFDVVSGGATVLTGETGTAVLDDGAWKVSETSFAGMMAAMGGSGGGTGTPSN